MDRATRIFLLLLAIGWAPYGFYCFFNPQMLAGIAGISAQTLSATTELRAMYGGVQAAIGLSALLAFFKPEYAVRALFLQVTIASGLAISRSLGAIMGGDASGYTLGALGFEWSIVLLALWFYRRNLARA